MQFFLQVRDSWPPNYLSRLIESLVDLGNIFARAARAFWTPAAFATNDWRDLLNQFIRLDLRRQFFRNGRDQGNISILRARKKDWTSKFWLKRIGNRLKQVSIATLHFRNAEIFSSVRGCQFVCDGGRPALQLRLSSFGSSLFPIVNLGLKFVQMRRPGVDLVQQLARLGLVYKGRQRGNIGFFAREHFELFLLARRLFFRPSARRVSGHRFNSPNTRCNCVLAQNSKWPDLSRRAYMGAAAELHRITVERFRFATDLQNADSIAVFLAKKLLNVGTFFRLGVRNFCPGNRRVLRDFFVHQFFHVADLLLRQCRARKIQRQFVRADITPFLRRIARNNFMQRPVQQVRRSMVSLNRFASIDIDCDTYRLSRLWRSSFHELRTMNKNIAALLCVDHAKLTNFGAIMPRDMQQTFIANLAAHFGVTRRAIENQV